MTPIPRKKSSRRQMQKEETRRIIMASAYALFGQQGYKKTTMRDLAAHADVGLGTIFKHFPDKPSLLLNTFYEDLGTVLQSTFDSIPPANIKMQLTHIAFELYEFFGHNQSFSRALLKEIFFLEGRYGEKLAGMAIFFQEEIRNVLMEAIRRDELNDGIDITNTFFTFLSFFILGLISGLREPEFGVKKQTMFFASLLDNHIAVRLRTGKP